MKKYSCRAVQTPWAGFALTLGFGLVGSVARAAYAPTDPVYAFASTELRYDDNVPLLAPGQSLMARSGYASKGDWISSVDIGVHAQTDWSRQRLSVDGSFSRHRYADNRQLDYSNWQHALAWHGVLTDKVQANFSLRDTSQQVGVGGQAGGQNDNVRRHAGTMQLVWAPSARLSFDVLAGRTQENRSLFTDYNYTEHDGTAGLTLASPRGSTLGVHADSRKVSYRQDMSQLGLSNTFTFNTVRLDGVWPVTDNTRLTGRLGRTRVQTEGTANTASTVGNLDLQWHAASKTKLFAGYGQDYDNPGRSKTPTINKNVHMGFEHQLSAKTLFSASLKEERRDESYSAIGTERTRTLRVSLRCKPFDAAEVSPYLQLVRRRSQAESDTYNDRQFGITVQLYF